MNEPKPHEPPPVTERERIERERRTSSMLHPANFMITTLGDDQEIDPDAVRRIREARQERDRALDHALDDLDKK